MKQRLPDEDCYQACQDAQPAWPGSQRRCICEQINAESDAYDAEPDGMFAMESGAY